MFWLESSACSCVFSHFSDKYSKASYVALVEVKMVYPNVKDSKYYKVDLDVKEVFKGTKTFSIFISGNYKGDTGAGCGISIPEGTVMILYADTYEEKLQINYCSGTTFIKDPNNTSVKRELLMLKLLKKNGVDFVNHTMLINNSNSIDLNQYDGINLTLGSFALYEITLDSNLQAQGVSIIGESGMTTIIHEIQSMISKSKWKMWNDKKEKPGKLIYAVFYYRDDDDSPGFLSNFDL